MRIHGGHNFPSVAVSNSHATFVTPDLAHLPGARTELDDSRPGVGVEACTNVVKRRW